MKSGSRSSEINSLLLDQAMVDDMDLRGIVRQAIQSDYDRRLVAALPDDDNEAVGDVVVSEYVIFLLALDTYMRYIEETSGAEPGDEVTMRGIRTLRIADSQIQESLVKFLDEQLPTDVHKRMLARAFRVPVAKPEAAARRALQLRTLITRGGPKTMRAIFETNRALRQIREAIAASMMDDGDAALDKFAGMQLRNSRIRNWITLAAKTAVAREIPPNAVEEGTNTSVDQASALLKERVQEAGSVAAEDIKASQDAQAEKMVEIQQDASQAARKALESAGEPDEPPKKSEVVGIATAAAVAALSDPSKPQNIPDPLRKLDDEQRAAALTDGRVLVAAGAGAGKSTSLVARVTYLVRERGVNPSRILVTSFNKKAGDELKQKITRSLGDAAKQMSIGTMHSLFKGFVVDYGTSEEKNAMGRGLTDVSKIARPIQQLWTACHPTPDGKGEAPPKLKTVLRYKSLWAGNNVTPKEAREKAQPGSEEEEAAEWYEFYEGYKGNPINWSPPCAEKLRKAKLDEWDETMSRSSESYREKLRRDGPKKTPWETFLAKFRPNQERLGDFDDMISMYRNILERSPALRKKIQSMYDHILVDEAQDRNLVQAQAFEMMAEHITDGTDGKSFWIIGDDKQSIYEWRGARPDLFSNLATAEGWKLRTIRTNYRCEPEIVDTANKLIAHNSGQIPMQAIPAPGKTRGVGSIRVKNPPTEAESALAVVGEIKANWAEGQGEDIAEHAILCRTNAELNAFETGCIVRGIPYARSGASSFLGSPETAAVMGYVQLSMGDDPEVLQKAFATIINTPNRFFLAPEAGKEIVANSIRDYARISGTTIKSVNPATAIADRRFREVLARNLTKSEFMARKAMGDLDSMAREISELQMIAADPEAKATDLFDAILGLGGKTMEIDPTTGKSRAVTQSFRESIQAFKRDAISEDEDEADDDADDATKGLGNIAFLFKLTEVDPTDPKDLIQNPNTPAGFKAKMDRLAERAEELRIDISKWEKAELAKPAEDRKEKPPGVFISTVHKVKGAQWRNVYVSMPAGKFPLIPPVKKGQPPPPPEKIEAEMSSERRLGYVALTRAAKNLTILCPNDVGGRPAGISSFVDEADLVVGENVPKTADVESPDVVKTAVQSEEYSGLVPDEWGEES